MLVKRLIVIIFLIPVAVAVITVGGWLFSILIAIVLSIATWEYWRIFRHGGYLPSAFILIAGVMMLAAGRHVLGFKGADILFSIILFLAIIVHLVGYERGQDSAAADFGITIGGVLYLGWLGTYLISLRDLPDGQWWVLLVLPAVWIADGGAYIVGRRFGRHQLAPRVSPKKTWEGYLGGILFGTTGTYLLAILWQTKSPIITPQKGLLIGLILSVITPLGDLGESMFKRQFGVKDSSALIPGHGGVMDRIDTWLWAAVIGYYMVVWAW